MSILRIVLLIVCTGAGMVAQSVPTVTTTPQAEAFLRHGIKVWSSADPDFAENLQKVLGAQLVDELGPLAKYSLVVYNGGATPIASITARFIMTQTAAPAKIAYGDSRLEFYPRDNPLPAGGAVVITPDTGISRLLFLRLSKSRISAPPGTLSSTVVQFVSGRYTARQMQTVIPMLDGVVLSTDVVIGPDSLDIIGEQEALNVAVDTITGKLTDNSLTDAQVREWLTNQLESYKKKSDYLGEGKFDHNVRQMRGMLQTALANMQQARGRPGMAGGLKQLVRHLSRAE